MNNKIDCISLRLKELINKNTDKWIFFWFPSSTYSNIFSICRWLQFKWCTWMYLVTPPPKKKRIILEIMPVKLGLQNHSTTKLQNHVHVSQLKQWQSLSPTLICLYSSSPECLTELAYTTASASAILMVVGFKATSQRGLDLSSFAWTKIKNWTMLIPILCVNWYSHK